MSTTRKTRRTKTGAARTRRAPSDAPYDPVTTFDAMTAKSRPTFNARTPAQARSWQTRTRKALAEYLGFLDTPRVDPDPRILAGPVDRGSYVRYKIALRTMPHAHVPLYLLIPKRASRQPLPAILALHGHGYGVKDIVGLWEDGSERLQPDGYHGDFGCALAEHGFVVAAPEIASFGERFHKYPNPEQFRMTPTCHGGGAYAIMMGGSLAGMRVLENQRILDYLATRREVNMDRIGAMGISGGGMNTFFTTAIDTRIKACVISGYFCEWRKSILDIFHCTCNYVPGLYKLGELSDLSALIAPRPCLVEHGMKDDIFPFAEVQRTVEKARRAWVTLGARENLQTDYFQGRHRINGEVAYRFLSEHLSQ